MAKSMTNERKAKSTAIKRAREDVTQHTQQISTTEDSHQDNLG